jgi:hypothetical protein
MQLTLFFDKIKFVPPVVNPVHNVLNLCGVTTAASYQIFIDIEGLDTTDAFATAMLPRWLSV